MKVINLFGKKFYVYSEREESKRQYELGRAKSDSSFLMNDIEIICENLKRGVILQHEIDQWADGSRRRWLIESNTICRS